VFYDSDFKSRMFGEKLTSDGFLDYAYGPASYFVVPFISRHYATKNYPHYEFQVALREAQERGYAFILPIRLDDSHVLGLREDIVYADLRTDSPQEIGTRLVEKLAALTGGAPVRPTTHWVATFGVAVEEFFDSLRQMENTLSVPDNYAGLCDWLQADILTRLRQSTAQDIRPTEDLRTGETYSLRVSFSWDRSGGPLSFGALDWWTVLEVRPYEEVYGDQPEPQTDVSPMNALTDDYDHRIAQALAERVSFDFIATPLDDVVAFLQNLLAVNIIIDRPSVLEAETLDITLKLNEVAVRSALNHICRQLRFYWHVQDEAIILAKQPARMP